MASALVLWIVPSGCWGVDRVKLEINTAGVNDVMIGARRDDHSETIFGFGFLAIDDKFGLALVDAEELIMVWVNFSADFFTGEKRHDNELAIGASKNDFPKVGVT